MPLIKKLLLAFVFAFLALALISLFMPSKWEVKRSVVIEAPASKVFPYFNILKNWKQWTPWSKETDMTLKWSYEGPDSGPGAVMRWQGSNTSSGEIRVLANEPNRSIRYEYNMGNGSMIAQGEITISTEGLSPGQVEVTWHDRGDTGYSVFARLFAGSLDEVVGPIFEKGLAKLKRLAELSVVK